MIPSSDSLDLVEGLLIRSKKYINTKQKEYRPIYNIYYMVIYVAIQDSLSYQKCNKLRGRSRSNQKYRNRVAALARTEAREWLLNSDDFDNMWRTISEDSPLMIISALKSLYSAIQKEADQDNSFNSKHRLSVGLTNRLRSMAL